MTITDIDPQTGGMGRPRSQRYAAPDDWETRGAQRRSRHDGPGWFARAETWLDERGKGAWIAAMVLGFIAFWPVGLVLLAYMIWSNRMFSSSCNASRASSGKGGRVSARREGRAMYEQARSAMRPSGNTTFDAYKTATLRRLEEEQSSFEAFLERLREAKDKAEFDQFMDDRAEAAREAAVDDEDVGAGRATERRADSGTDRDAPKDSQRDGQRDAPRDRNDRGDWTGSRA